MKKIVSALLLIILVGTSIYAQQNTNIDSSITLTTEGLWNTTTGIANWVNILNADHEFGLWKGGSFSLDLVAINNLRHEQGKCGVADDLYLFSAIEDAQSTLALTAFGIGQRLADDKVFLYAGIRNLGKDYFTMPWNSVFTSAMNGLFPTISTNFAVADPPMAAMALHAEWHPTPEWSAKLSIYDGVASELWSELFSLNLARDGVFMIGDVGYTGNPDDYLGTYNLGATFGYAPTMIELEREGREKSSHASLWFLAEQPIFRQKGGREVQLLFHGAWAPQGHCDMYGAAGIVCRSLFAKEDYLGFLVSRGLYKGGYETQLEVTYSYEWRYLKLQPALHRIHAKRGDYTVAMMKVIIEI